MAASDLNSILESPDLSWADLAERQRQFDQQMAWQREQWQNQGVPNIEIAQREMKLREDEFAWQKQYQQQTFDWQKNIQQQQQDWTKASGQANLGLNYLQQAAQLRGPSDWLALSNFMRGAQGNPDVPLFLQSLATNTQPGAVTGMQGTNAPTPQTMESLTAKLTGTPSGTQTSSVSTGSNVNETLDAIRGILQRGGAGLAPGSLERLTPAEMGVLQGGIEGVGGSMPDFLKQYQRGGIGQTAMGAGY